jgi:hypothetical protein
MERWATASRTLCCRRRLARALKRCRTLRCNQRAAPCYARLRDGTRTPLTYMRPKAVLRSFDLEGCDRLR